MSYFFHDLAIMVLLCMCFSERSSNCNAWDMFQRSLDRWWSVGVLQLLLQLEGPRNHGWIIFPFKHYFIFRAVWHLRIHRIVPKGPWRQPRWAHGHPNLPGSHPPFMAYDGRWWPMMAYDGLCLCLELGKSGWMLNAGRLGVCEILLGIVTGCWSAGQDLRKSGMLQLLHASPQFQIVNGDICHAGWAKDFLMPFSSIFNPSPHLTI